MAVTKVLTIRVIKDEKYKFDEALRFFKSRLTDPEPMSGERFDNIN